MHPHIYSQLIYDYRIKNIQWWKGSIYKKYWEKLDTYMQKEETRTLPLGSYSWVRTQNGKDLNVRSETIKPLEENISRKLFDNSLGDDFFDLTPSESHSVVSNSLWPHRLQHSRASLPFTFSQSLLKLMSIESVMPSNHPIFCHPLLLLPSIFPSIRVFTNETALLIGGPKYWSFSFSPSNEYSGLISFRIDWFDLLAVQGTLRSLLQHNSSKACELLVVAYGIKLPNQGWLAPCIGSTES